MSYKPPGGCESVPEILKYWDGSRYATSKSCWRKHWLGNVRGLRRNGAPSVHLTWGKAYHACAELFDKLIVSGMSHASAKERTLTLAEKEAWDEELDQPRWGEWFTLSRCTASEMRPHKTDPTKLVHKSASERCPWSKGWWEHVPADGEMASFCECGEPIETSRRWLPEHKKKTAKNLIHAVEAYCDEPGLPPYGFADPDQPVTEVQHILPLPIISTDGDPYQLVLNIDSICDHHGWAAIRERKTTGAGKLDEKFWRGYEMTPQTDTYDIGGRAVYADEDRPPKVLVEVTRIAENGEVEIKRRVLEIPETRAEEHFEEFQEHVLEAERRTLMYHRGNLSFERAFPRNTTACHGKYSTCAFWRLCTAAPEEREGIIASEYHVEHWDPLAAESVVEEE